ncbi:hypothetical protein KCP74_13105 [Salmonella enterica subsp. enterica]|nr:hypothetical protein KCP74_13105 [Salmonella enterica subsp. enterica]
MLTGATPPDTGILGIMKDVPRIANVNGKSWRGICRALLCCCWFLFYSRYWPNGLRRCCGFYQRASDAGAIQYCDARSMQNHKAA